MKQEQKLRSYKKEATTAARELYYPPEVLRKIQQAKTEDEISRIMFNARMKKYA